MNPRLALIMPIVLASATLTSTGIGGLAAFRFRESLNQGMPMTYQSDYQVNTLEPAAMGTDSNNQPKQQTIVLGPLAAFVPMKMMGTNGGGFFGMNSAHPFENPGAGTNFFEAFCMMLFPMALVLMYGRMLKRLRHAIVIFSVMLTLFIGTVVWAIYHAMTHTLLDSPRTASPAHAP